MKKISLVFFLPLVSFFASAADISSFTSTDISIEVSADVPRILDLQTAAHKAISPKATLEYDVLTGMLKSYIIGTKIISNNHRLPVHIKSIGVSNLSNINGSTTTATIPLSVFFNGIDLVAEKTGVMLREIDLGYLENSNTSKEISLEIKPKGTIQPGEGRYEGTVVLNLTYGA